MFPSSIRFRTLSIQFTLLAVLALLATGCLNDGKLSAIQYNNKFVKTINTSSGALKESTNIYDQQIPTIVTEDSTIAVSELETTLIFVQEYIKLNQALLPLESKNAEQQTATQTELAIFLSLADTYIKTYTDMIAYYKGGDYKTNLDKVATFDQDLHAQYNDFIASHNKLVDILAEFVE